MMIGKSEILIQLILIFLICVSCTSDSRVSERNAKKPATAKSVSAVAPTGEPNIAVGAERTEVYLPKLAGKRVGMMVNQSSLVGSSHLVDHLLAQKVDVKKVYAPEHGFRGKADAGEKVKDGKDEKTGLPIISLYGKNRKPTA